MFASLATPESLSTGLEELKVGNDIIERMEERENQNRMLIKAMMDAQNQSQND